MWYLIGLISGVIAGIAMFWFIPIGMKDFEKYMKFSRFSSREFKFYIFSGFVVLTFLFGPIVSYMYSIRIIREGQGAFLEHAILITVTTLTLFFTSFLYNIKDAKNIIKTIWKGILIFYLIFAFSFGWLIPILYKWFAG